MNPHKKGEHVFNDIAGSLENALLGALKSERANSLVLANRYGPLRLNEFPQSAIALERIGRDVVLTQARTVVAPATGIHNDQNSIIYGRARKKLEDTLAEAVAAAADLAWKSKPRSNSSFHEFEAVVKGLRTANVLKVEANQEINALIDSAYDAQAEKSTLTERVGDLELERRRAAIQTMKQHLPVLKQAGYGLMQTFFAELETVLKKRIGGA